MKILFLNPNLNVEKEFIDYPYFININMLQAVAILKKKGYEVEVLDMFAQSDSDVTEKDNFLIFGSKTNLNSLIKKKDFDVAIILNSPFLKLFNSKKNREIQNVMKTIKSKKNNPRIILADCHIGGMHFVDYEETKIKEQYPLIDSICKGECENKLLDILNNKKQKTKLKLVKDLDSLPLPDYNCISMVNYGLFLKKISEKGYAHFLNMDSKTMAICTSRGCIYNCSFCTSRINGRYYRNYSLKYVKKNLRLLKKNFGITKVILLDELINPNEKRINDLISLLNNFDLKYEFPNGLRADNLSEKIIKKMKERVTLISVSAESGSQRVVNSLLNKNLNLSSISRVAKICMKSGVLLQVHFMIGIKGENMQEINRTLEFAIGLYEKYKAIPLLQLAVPIPGSCLYFNSKVEKNKINQDSLNDKQKILDNYVLYFKSASNNKNIYGIDPKIINNFIENFKKRLISKDLEKIIINVTYECNNNCIFCAVGKWRGRNASIEDQKNRLKEAYNFGIRMVDFDGGEPTLSTNLFPLINYSKNLGYKQISLISNGRLFSIKKNVEKIFNTGVNSIIISLHGPDSKTHEEITRAKGSFEQTLKGIKNIISFNIGKKEKVNLAVNITLTKKNIISLPLFFELVNSIGVKKVNIQFITPFGLAEKKDLPTQNQIESTLPTILRKYSKKIDINIINLPFCFLPHFEKYLVSDIFKSNRNMVFIGKEESNLADFLGSKRYKDKDCLSCIWNIICNGKWKFIK